VDVNLRLDWCSYKAAKFAVEHWHYSKTIPRGKLVNIGCWENDFFIGCLIYSYNANNRLGNFLNLNQFQVIELVRIALKKHSNPVSKMIAISLKLIKKNFPNILLCISYADPNQNHLGGIYQASNWIYMGKTSNSKGYVLPNGEISHSRNHSEKGFIKRFYGEKQSCIKPSLLKKIILPGKHKYAYPLNDGIKKQLESFAKPYPKSAGSIDSDAPPHQGGEGGAEPTPAL